MAMTGITLPFSRPTSQALLFCILIGYSYVFRLYNVDEVHQDESDIAGNAVKTSKSQQYHAPPPLDWRSMQPPPLALNVTIPYELFGKDRFFVTARSDRSGAAILDYLKGLSFALEFGVEFGGVCGDSPLKSTHEAMIATLGLDTLIQLDKCPNNRSTDFIGSGADRIHDRGVAGSFSSRPVLDYLRSVSLARRRELQGPAASREQHEQRQIGVHIRRGDVNPCGYHLKYLPNAFYLKLIDQQHVSKKSHVTIYSESNSHEDWSCFSSTYNLMLDGNISDTWQSMLESDVLILSWSSFSILPAIISSRAKTVVYPPTLGPIDQGPLPEWTIVPRKRLEEGMNLTVQLRENCTDDQRKAASHGLQTGADPFLFVWPKDTIPDMLFGKKKFFVSTRSGGPWSVLLDYLQGLSFALEFGMEFGGVCGRSKMMTVHEDMIAVLGLDTLIRLGECPTNTTTDIIETGTDKNRTGTDRIHNRGIAGSFSSRPALDYIRSTSLARRREQKVVIPASKQKQEEVGVHIRRGDITPCGFVFQRYIPNAFYLKLIDQHVSNKSHVTIYSESTSHEGWSDFSSKYRLALDGNISDVCHSMLESDTLILSRSFLSIVQAIVSSRAKTVIYLPLMRKDPGPLPEWSVVPRQALNEGMQLTESFKHNCTAEQISTANRNEMARRNFSIPFVFRYLKSVVPR